MNNDLLVDPGQPDYNPAQLAAKLEALLRELPAPTAPLPQHKKPTKKPGIAKRLKPHEVRTQHDCEDPEDNLILDLAAFTDAAIIVSNDSDLLILGRRNGWRRKIILSPDDFTKRAEVATRRR